MRGRDMEHSERKDVQIRATEIASSINALPQRNTPNVRALRRNFSKRLAGADPDFILALAHELIDRHELRWVAYELVADHKAAYQSLDEAKLEALGHGINSWYTVDSFARVLSGPAWRDGLISADVIQRWSRSPDRWWRRAALVSTVALNVRSHGGYGDALRTLSVCRLLVADHDDMVVKALSWALRELVPHDAQAVRAFLEEHDAVLAARVKREVRNKLQTGLKNP